MVYWAHQTFLQLAALKEIKERLASPLRPSPLGGRAGQSETTMPDLIEDHDLPFATEATGDALIDPLTGELIELTADQLIDAFERLDRHAKHVNAGLYEIRRELLKLAQGDAKTRRLRHADGRTLVLTLPGESWDQSKLKEVANSYPELAKEFLRIEKYAVNILAYKKAANTTSTDAYMNAVKMIRDACRPSTAPPTVRIEHVSGHHRT